MIDIVQCPVDATVQAYAKTLGFSKVLHRKNMKIAEGGSDLFNRDIVSNKHYAVLMNPERQNTKDTVHYRRSGLNHVLAALARKHHVAIGFGFSFLLSVQGLERARILGRMQQNVRICHKARAPMIVCSYAKNMKEMRSAQDLQAFARLLGMTGAEAKKALRWKKREPDVLIFD